MIPHVIWNKLHVERRKFMHYKAKRYYQQHFKKKIQSLQQKNEPLTVLFLALEASSWKYDSLYLEMLNDPCFYPYILVCPQVNRGYDYMIERLDMCAEFFEKKHYKYIKTYDASTQRYFDAHTLSPDIICFTNPYDGLIDSRYYIDKFPNSLTCYINYAYNNHIHEWGYNLPFHQSLWRYYVECEDNLDLIKKCSSIDGVNCVVTGYPMFDIFAKGTTTGKDWKLNDEVHKRIIWSPHHTIDGRDDLIKYSTFLLYYDKMWEIAQKYRDKIEIVFKPHPLLKVNLYEHPEWGKERTDAYYEQWAKGENTSLVDGEYIDLFKTSDAMINDSGSFMIEYLYVQKPCLCLNNYDRQKDANIASAKAFACWYHATTEIEVERFITEVVIKERDTMNEKRETFYNDVLLPPNGCSVAENIINDMKSVLNYKKR